MKKKQKILLLIIIVIITILGIIIFVKNKDNNKKRLEKIYKDLEVSQTYLFEMKQNDTNKTIMAKKGDKTIIDDYAENNHTTTIVKDNNTYLVLHDREEYYLYEQNNVEQAILTDALEEVLSKEFSKGTEKIKGQKYVYEEYNGSTIFMKANSLDVKEEDIKTRFYFDNNDNLVYIRTIKGVNQELLEINMKREVDDSIFEVPSNYAENS